MLIGCDLVGGNLGIDCPDLRLEEGDVCRLPAVVVVKQVIALHELLGVHLDYRTVHRHLAHVHCPQHCRGEGLTSRRSNPLILGGPLVAQGLLPAQISVLVLIVLHELFFIVIHDLISN